MFTLKLVFVGLIAFHDQTPIAGPFYAFLVDARTPTEEQCDYKLHAHKPFVSFPMENWDPASGSARPPEVVVDAKGEEIGIIWLDHEELTLGSATPSPLWVQKDPRVQGESPAMGQERDLRWVVDMQDLNYSTYQFHRLKQACFASPVQAPLVARLVIDAGSISVDKLGRGRREKGAPVHVFSFDPVNVIHRQALADRVVVELEVSGSEVRIESDVRPPIVLRPTSFKPVVEMVVGNLPLDVGSYDLEPETHVDDFRWFFELVQATPPLGVRPLPRLPDGGAGSGAGVFCPAVEF